MRECLPLSYVKYSRQSSRMPPLFGANLASAAQDQLRGLRAIPAPPESRAKEANRVARAAIRLVHSQQSGDADAIPLCFNDPM
jgi:hypothetical protein